MKSLILLFSMPICIAVKAQVKFQEGYLVTIKGDTLTGLIRWQDQHAFFKQKDMDEPKKYPWSELTCAYNKNSDQIVRMDEVQINLEYLDFDYNIKQKDSIITATLPLRLIYNGKKISLYEYRGLVNYYFLNDGKGYHQLVQNYRYLTESEKITYHDPVPKYFVLNKWQGLLFSYYDFNKDKKMHFILENTVFDAISLKGLISRIDKKIN